jgi:hypothetical protein
MFLALTFQSTINTSRFSSGIHYIKNSIQDQGSANSAEIGLLDFFFSLWQQDLKHSHFQDEV